LRRKLRGYKTSTASLIHQAATGFVAPAFLILCFSYMRPDLVKELTPHELGLAGLLALIITVRECLVDGVEDEDIGTQTA
jgi:hypothetical protein